MTGSPSAEQTAIPGLVLLHLPLRADPRGWFTESWHEEKLAGLGVAAFRPVQANVAQSHRGVTRGFHAEPWDKYVTVAHGRAFAAWVDLREGPGFGVTVHHELAPGTAALVPRGVGNAYQALTDDTVYTYLVDAHWRPGTHYVAVNPGDAMLGISWPIPLSGAALSDKDRQAPSLVEVDPLLGRRTLILGGRGQLGRALSRRFPDALVVGREQLDLIDGAALEAWPWHDVGLILNAAAHTDVDAAETPDGRIGSWLMNADLPSRLARQASLSGATLVHFSTDYVFDGRRPVYDESAPFSPLGVYGQAKAAGDLAVATTPRHYLVRTSWLVGEGRNFVRTMVELAKQGASPTVVEDQVGRLTFADELAQAVVHLLDTRSPYGTYNCTAAGPSMSWADIARAAFRHVGRDPGAVIATSTADYTSRRQAAPRPAHSTLDLTKIEGTGWRSAPGAESLTRYLSTLDV